MKYEKCVVLTEKAFNEHLQNGWKKDEKEGIGPNGEIYMIRDISHKSIKLHFPKELTGK